MTTTIDFYFDVGSPASYLAWTQLPDLAARTEAHICWKPMLLGGVFKATGNQSPAMVPAKSRYNLMDMARFARGYKVPLNFNPYFPINTLQLMRGTVAYLDRPEFSSYLRAIFNGIWVEERNLGDGRVVADVLSNAGFDPADVIARCEDATVKERLKKFTEEAVGRGVFGAPTFFVDDEMFFGQDRLDQVEKHLQSN